MDDFNRADGDTVGNDWVEVETSGAVANIQNNRLCVPDASDASNRPLVKHTFQPVTSGQLRWQFDFDWDYTGPGFGYQILLQLGQGSAMSDDSDHNGIGVDLVWTWRDGGHEKLAAFDGAFTTLGVVSGQHTITVLADLDTATYEVLVDGVSLGSGIAFEDSVSLDTVRLVIDGLGEQAYTGRCFDNLDFVTLSSRRSQSRAAPTTGFSGPGSPDEYPFASTYEGGAGAFVRGVSVQEQRIQGGIISRFFQSNNIADGSKFRVRVK